MVSIAIVGAGLSGLTCAHLLTPYANVSIFEKSRGVGGRLATRRAEPFAFDHGVQSFTVSTQAFADFISPMIREGILTPWLARFVELSHQEIISQQQWSSEHPHYVAVPGMNAMGKWLANSLDIHHSFTVSGVSKAGEQWVLHNDKDEKTEPFDWVLYTAPAPQTLALLPRSFEHYSQIRQMPMQGCFSLMLGFDSPQPLPFDVAIVHDADIDWISVNSAKPGRPDPYALLVHATNQWADVHMEEDAQWVLEHLCEQTSMATGHDMHHAAHKAVHRWRYANSIKQEKGFFIDRQQQIGVCGDWCIQGKLEAAFTSAQQMAQAIQGELKDV